MSRFQRVRQWSAFSRNWHIYDAKWQNPFQSAKKISPYLEGKNKPIYSPFADSGDHVVVINSKDISLLGREWQMRVYFHHTGYNKSFPGGGAKWIPAWQLHSRDPTLVLWKAVYNNMHNDNIVLQVCQILSLRLLQTANVPMLIQAVSGTVLSFFTLGS